MACLWQLLTGGSSVAHLRTSTLATCNLQCCEPKVDTHIYAILNSNGTKTGFEFFHMARRPDFEFTCSNGF